MNFRFTIYKVNKASKKKREKSSAKKERKATKTLAIVLGERKFQFHSDAATWYQLRSSCTTAEKQEKDPKNIWANIAWILRSLFAWIISSRMSTWSKCTRRQTNPILSRTHVHTPASMRAALRWSVFTFHPSVTTYDLRLILRTRSFIWKHESFPYTVCITLRWINLLNILMPFPRSFLFHIRLHVCALSYLFRHFPAPPTLCKLHTWELCRLVYCLPSLPISSFSPLPESERQIEFPYQRNLLRYCKAIWGREVEQKRLRAIVGFFGLLWGCIQ